MLKHFYIKLLLFLLLLVDFISADATHIVGGVMNYRYLGNDQYEVSLYVYRDCINGVPPLDDPAIIRIWDGVSESYRFPSIPFDSILDPGLPDACARIETPVCVNWTRYRDTLILPPNDFGYTIYYQRCCRNNTIVNLTYDSRGYGVMDWGATYTINIPPASPDGQNISNASPYFVNYPPVYICVNKPIVYDNSAIDADGDSLVYRLCTPYTGAFPDDPLNYYIEETPPFEQVIWDSSFSVSDMLGGVPLSIHPATGLLTGTPNRTGQYVVGICVDEYRNGQLLTQTTRDFQFNIIDCNLQVVSSFFAPTIQCNNFTVDFQNESSGATDYKWYFGDGDSSILENPSHTYRDTGKYTVTLISYNSITNTCLSRYTQVISIQYKKIEADFTVNAAACLSLHDPIRFTDRSTDALNVVAWKWNFSTCDSSILQNPTIFYNGRDTIISATLTVTSSNGCTSTTTRSIRLFPKIPYTLNRVITKCTNTGAAQISLNMDGNNIFSWSPATGLNNPNISNPTTTVNSNTTYHVTIKTPLPNGDTCIQRDSVQIKTINTVQINATDTLSVCNDSVRLSVPLSPGQTVSWSNSGTFSPIIGTSPSISIRQTTASQIYYVKITAQECEAIDSILVLYNDTIPSIDLADNILQCTNQVALNASVNYSDHIIWSTSPTFTPVISNSNAYSTIQIPKTVRYYIKVSYKACSNTDSIKVSVQDTLPLIALDDSLNICGGNNVNIRSTVRRFTSLIWSSSSDFSNIIGTTQNISVTPSGPRQVYYIKAFYRDCFVTDSILVNYNNQSPSVSLDDSLFVCGSTFTLQATIANADTVIWSDHPGFSPVISTEPTFTVTAQNPVQTYYVKVASGFCSATDSMVVRTETRLPQISLDDRIFVCADSVRIHANINNYDSLKWSEDIGFSYIIDTIANLSIRQTEDEKMYYLKVYYGTCTLSDSIKVFYNDILPSVSLDSPHRFCSDSVFAYAFVDYATETEWFENRDFTHLIGTNLTLQITQPQGAKWYYFRASYKSCAATDSILLENRSLKYTKQDAQACIGDNLDLRLNVQTAAQYDVIWYANKDTFETNNISTLSIIPDSTQTVYFHISNLYGCSTEDSLNITVNPKPVAEASVDKPVIYAGEQVQLTVTQGQGYSYYWTPSTLVNDATIYNPSSSPLQTTLYTVIVSDRKQCSSQDTLSVQVIQNGCNPSSIYIPDAFSPNGDGINDLFRVRSGALKGMHLEIYDRWGIKVFETENLNDGWNGSYKGQAAPADAYGYYFTGECLQGEKISLKGNVTLLR